MHKSLLLHLTLLLGLITCAKMGLQAPNRQEISSKQTQGQSIDALDSSDSLALAITYLEAKKYAKNGQKEMACKLYQKLEQVPDFPLSILVKIGRLKNCKDAIASQTLPLQIPNWAKEEFYQTVYEKAQENKDSKLLAKSLLELSSFEKTQKDKEEKLIEAHKWAKVAHDIELLKIISKTLIDLAPRFTPSKEIKKLKGDDLFKLWIKIGKDYEKRREFEKARSFYNSVIYKASFGSGVRAKALEVKAMSFKKERNLDEYIDQRKAISDYLKKVYLKSPLDHKITSRYLRSKILYARVLWSYRTIEESKRELNQVLQSSIKYPGILSQVHYLLGLIALEEKKFDQGIENFKKGNDFCLKPYELCFNITWQLGLNYYLNKDYKDASVVFKNRLESIEDDDKKSQIQKEKITFWLAKSLKKVDPNNSKIKDYLQQIIEEDPISYYSILSYKELNQKIPKLDSNSSIDKYKNNTFEWAMALDETEVAQKMAKEMAQKARSDKDKAQILPLLQEASEYQGAMKTYYQLSTEFRKDNQHELLPFVFPMPYQEIVQKWSHSIGLDPAIVWSIMRQESGFDPFARSWADAFGLLQLTPESAKHVAKRHGVEVGDLSDAHALYQEDLNIRLGTLYLKDLFSKNDGQFVHAVASYNAGSAALHRWLKERFDPQCLEQRKCLEGSYEDEMVKFIEVIPYEETKKYVKLVFRNYMTYRRLESSQDFFYPPNALENIFR